MLAQKKGTGTPAFTHSGLLLPDHEGVYVDIDDNSAPWHGARKVTNWTAQSNNALGARWLTSNATVTSDGNTGPQGQESWLVEHTTTTGYLLSFGTQTDILPTVAKDVVVSCWIYPIEYAGSHLAVYVGPDNTLIFITESVAPLNQWTKISVLYSGYTGNQPGWSLRAVGGGGANQSYKTCEWQFEWVDGQSNQNPSEYVENTDQFFTASKYYANLNGNTVLNNVVTEAIGTPLAELPSLYAAPALTNQVQWSRDLTNAWWFLLSGTAVVTYDQDGLTGEPNTASLVDDQDAGNANVVYKNFPITADGNPRTARFFIKKDSDQTRFPQLEMTSGWISRWALDTSLGTLVPYSGNDASADAVVDSVGDWWAITMTVDNDGAAAQTYVYMTPAARSTQTADGALEPALQGSIIVGGVELYGNQTIAEVRGAGAIVTAGSTVTSTEVWNDYDIANNNQAQSAYYVEGSRQNFANWVTTGDVSTGGKQTLITMPQKITVGFNHRSFLTVHQGLHKRVFSTNTHGYLTQHKPSM
jgi:hypothetical protein